MAVKLELYRVFQEVARMGNIGAEPVYIPVGSQPVHQAAGGAAAGPAVFAQHARRRPDQRGKAFAGLCLARIGAYPVRRGKACAVAPAAHG